jgi:hypothetical protein
MSGRPGKGSEAPPLGGRGMSRGLTRTVVAFKPQQLEALRAEARRRMRARKVRKIDAGEVIREAVDAWMKRRRP